jgi:hypothetical protein
LKLNIHICRAVLGKLLLLTKLMTKLTTLRIFKKNETTFEDYELRLRLVLAGTQTFQVKVGELQSPLFHFKYCNPNYTNSG